MYEIYEKIITVLSTVNTVYCFFVAFWIMSYMSQFRKRTWIANFTAEEQENMPEYRDSGYYKTYYTPVGRIIRSIGFGGLTALVLTITQDIWYELLSILVAFIAPLPSDGQPILIFAASLIGSIKCYERL